MAYRPPPEILASLRTDLGVPAYIGSDRKIFQGSDDGFGTNEHARQVARQRAKEEGVDITGAKYIPTLAESQGDPKGWVRDTIDISNRAMELGAEVDLGGRKIKGPTFEVPDDKPYEVADDIVEREVEGIVCNEHGGSVSGKEYNDIFHEVKEKRSDVLI